MTSDLQTTRKNPKKVKSSSSLPLPTRARKRKKPSKSNKRRRSPSPSSSDSNVRIRKKDSTSRRKRKKKRTKSESRKLDSKRDGSERGRRRKRENRRKRKRSTSSSHSTSDSEEESGRRRDSRSKRSVRKKRRSRRYRSLSPSCSACSGSSASRSCSSERFVERTRSRERSRCESHREERAEIKQDYADFPSSRSNDSLSERRFASTDSPEKRRVDDDGRETVDDARDGEDGGMPYYTNHSGDEFVASEAQADERPAVRVKSEIIVPSAIVEPVETDDLESILRQRALENLKKFRGVFRDSAVQTRDGLAKKESNMFTDEQVQIKQDVGAVDTDANRNVMNPSEGMFQSEGRDKCETNDIVPFRIHSEAQSNERDNEKLDNETGVRTATFKEERSYSPIRPQGEEKNVENVMEKASAGGSPHNSEPNKGPENHIAKSGIGEGSTSTPSGAEKDVQKTKINEPKDEAGTKSELEKKTMTVMRGGEMVEVSYKVYIPKKNPALARRQLLRR